MAAVPSDINSNCAMGVMKREELTSYWPLLGEMIRWNNIDVAWVFGGYCDFCKSAERLSGNEEFSDSKC